MECPIKNHAFETSAYKGKGAGRDCTKEECAWWDEINNCCSIKNISLIYRGSFAKYAGED